MGKTEEEIVTLQHYTAFDDSRGEMIIPRKEVNVTMTKKKMEWYRNRLEKHYSELLRRDIKIVFQYKGES